MFIKGHGNVFGIDASPTEKPVSVTILKLVDDKVNSSILWRIQTCSDGLTGGEWWAGL